MKDMYCYTIIRVFLGIIFTGHGCQKLFGWFGGSGLEGTEKLFEAIGFEYSLSFAIIVGVFELVGGILFLFGYFLSVAAFMVCTIMVGAMIKVHGPNGIWAVNDGFEYNLFLIIVAIGIALSRSSLEHG